MTELTISWQAKQKENKLTDADLSSRVKERIKKWEKRASEVAELEQAIQGATLEMNQHKKGSMLYRDKKREIKLMSKALVDKQKEADDLNTALCDDMDRLVRNADAIAKSRQQIASLKNKPAAGAPAAATTDLPPVTNNEPSAAAEPNSTTAIPLMITEDMRQQLYILQYNQEDVDKMKPEEAQQIIATIKVKEQPAAPAATEPITTATESGETEPAPASQGTGAATATAAPPAPPQKPAKIIKITDTAPDSNKKKGWGAVIFGAILGLLAGAAIGVAIKGRK